MSRSIEWAVTDFPQPDSPTSPIVLPSARENERSRTARSFPPESSKCTLSPSIRITAARPSATYPGVVVAPSVWWRKLSPDGRNANAVTGQGLTDMGRAATFYDCLVEVAGL